MKISDSIKIESHFSAPTGDDKRVFLSSLRKGLEDCRLATNRDIATGERLPNRTHDSWVGALGYLALLDHIGTCFHKEKSSSDEDGKTNSLVLALKIFSQLPDDEIAAIYAMRCAFAHDFSLFNMHPSKPELTHCFRFFGQTDEPMVQLPKKRWDGNYRNRPPECFTAIGLSLIGDLVENICNDLKVLALRNELKIRLPGGGDELIDRYSLMKNV